MDIVEEEEEEGNKQTEQSQKALEVVRGIMISIKTHNFRDFKQHFEVYKQKYCTDEERDYCINHRISDILNERNATNLKDQEGLFTLEESIPFVMALKTLIEMEENESQTKFKACTEFIRQLHEDFRPNLIEPFEIEGCNYDVCNYFISKSEKLSDNKCRIILFFLLQLGAVLYSEAISALYCSVKEGNPVCFHLLLEKGAKFKNEDEEDALLRAIEHQRNDILKVLLEQHKRFKCKFNTRTNILHEAASLFMIYGGFTLQQYKDSLQTVKILNAFLKDKQELWNSLIVQKNKDNETPADILKESIMPKIQNHIQDAQEYLTELSSAQYGTASLREKQAAKAELQKWEEARKLLLQCLRYLVPKYQERLQVRQSVAMGLHRRLGQNSPLRVLDQELLKKITDHALDNESRL